MGSVADGDLRIRMIPLCQVNGRGRVGVGMVVSGV